MTWSEKIDALMRHAARWAIAAGQDRSPVIALLHANYAVGYILALRDIASDAEVLRISGRDPYVLFGELLAIQDQATRALVARCPDLIPGPVHLARLAGES